MNIRTIIFIIPLVLLLTNCCPPCEKRDFGLFQIESSSLEWMKFADSKSRIFDNIDGNQVTYTYFDPVADSEEIQINCDNSVRCGICCETMEGEYFFVQLADPNGTRIFNIILQKDLLRNDPGGSTAIPDYISISVNDRMECEITDLATTTLEESIDLDGQVFANVLKCERNPDNLLPGDPEAFYFTKSDGIVGFKFVGEAVWRLRP